MSSYTSPHIVNCIKNLENRYLTLGETVNRHDKIFKLMNVDVLDRISEDVDYLIKSESNTVNKLFDLLDTDSNPEPTNFTLNLANRFDTSSYDLQPKVYSEKIISLPIEIVIPVTTAENMYSISSNMYIDELNFPAFNSENDQYRQRITESSIDFHESSHNMIKFYKCIGSVCLFDLLRIPASTPLDLEKFGVMNQEHIELASSDYSIIIGGKVYDDPCKLSQLVLSRAENGEILITGGILMESLTQTSTETEGKTDYNNKLTTILQPADAITIILNTTKLIDINMSNTIKGLFTKLLTYSALALKNKNNDYMITEEFMNLVNSTLFIINKFYYDSFDKYDPETGLITTSMTTSELKFVDELAKTFSTLYGFNVIHSLFEKGINVFIEPKKNFWTGSKEVVV